MLPREGGAPLDVRPTLWLYLCGCLVPMAALWLAGYLSFWRWSLLEGSFLGYCFVLVLPYAQRRYRHSWLRMPDWLRHQLVAPLVKFYLVWTSYFFLDHVFDLPPCEQVVVEHCAAVVEQYGACATWWVPPLWIFAQLILIRHTRMLEMVE